MAMNESRRIISADAVSDDAATLPLAWRAGRNAEQKEEILRRRARALAAPLVDEGPVEVAEFVTFDLGVQRFSIETDLVGEVVSLDGLAALPGTPSFILGLLNVRGQIVAAVDLSPVLGVGQARADWPQVVIVRSGRVEVAIAADACGVARVARNELRPPAAAETRPYVKAVDQAGLGVLDVEHLIADTQRMLQAQAGREANVTPVAEEAD